ncbi:MAG: hypothetical protein IJ785_08745 [Bacteroidales bacterium]|nr:hypothetical protein [Bacteroidales bacterium]
MKKTHIYKLSLVLAAALPLCPLYTSCSKEANPIMDKPVFHLQQNQLVYYSVDGIPQQVAIMNNCDMDIFLNKMIVLAKEGHSVSFCQHNLNETSLSKEVIKHVTTDANDAKEWSDKKIKEGYLVEITYNDNTGEYTCIATK